jgi:tetratricopeptide (TPR) repeat protein
LNKDDYQLIEAYLNNDLDPIRLKQVEKRISSDQEFSDEVVMRKSMQYFLQHREQKAALNDRLTEISNPFFEGPQVIPIKKNTRRWWMSAAAAILLLGIFYFLLPRPSLYERYAQHTPLSLVEKGTTSSSLQQTEAHYNAGNYKEALPLLQQLVADQSDDLQLNLALGIALLETGSIPEARRIFQQIHEGTSIYHHEGSWYLALTYLKTNQHAEAKTQLQQIPSSAAQIYAKAQRLLQDLN